MFYEYFDFADSVWGSTFGADLGLAEFSDRLPMGYLFLCYGKFGRLVKQFYTF